MLHSSHVHGIQPTKDAPLIKQIRSRPDRKITPPPPAPHTLTRHSAHAAHSAMYTPPTHTHTYTHHTPYNQ